MNLFRRFKAALLLLLLLLQPLLPPFFLSLFLWSSARADPPSSSTSVSTGNSLTSTTAAKQDSSISTKLIPLPIYATLPNEGPTYGFMPVFLFVDKNTERTQSIIAPDGSWNKVIDWTGTGRWFYYPSNNKTLTVVGSVSTNVNWGGRLEWNNEPRFAGESTDDALYRFGRNIFYRYFGSGPDSDVGDQTSYTRVISHLSYRRGWNATDQINIGVRGNFYRDVVENITVPGYLSSTDVFPTTPGMNTGATIVEESLDVRYDSRPDRDYSRKGFYADISAGPVEGVSNSPDYAHFEAETKGLIEESERFQTGGRVYWNYVTSDQVPFYYQTSLGGSYLLRGFIEDRFIDQGGWTGEVEQRISLFQTHIYGVTTDWRVDPFFAIGQVYHSASDLFSNIRKAGGLGFRAWVRPNVLGRVDVAYGSEGINTYVELGYAF